MRSTKKEVRQLDKIVRKLLADDHVLEANYHYAKLLEMKPNHEKSLSLGYKIAIRMFNFEQVRFFDKRLVEIRAKEDLIVSLKLEFYCSVANELGVRNCLEWFLQQGAIDSVYLNLIVDASIMLKQYEYMEKVLKFMGRANLIPGKRTENFFKKIALERLVIVLSRVKL